MLILLRQFLFATFAFLALVLHPAWATEASGGIGVVVMHGKGGMPAKFVGPLATALQEKGILVANLEMPWSGRRDYDVDVSAGEQEVESSLQALRTKGAQKLFVAGHSQGGLFALYFGGKHAVDGVIAIAPGGGVEHPFFRERLGESVEEARRLVAAGKGAEKARLYDAEGARGTYPVIAPAAAYLTWFDPDGAMNQSAAVKNMNPATPVLFIVPKRDYPGLLKQKQSMFDALPKHPLTRLYEPDSGHLDAPVASLDEIARWMSEVARK